MYLSGEVTNDVGVVSTPQSGEPLLLDGSVEALADALVWGRQATLLDHLILVLNEELHTLDGGSCSTGARAKSVLRQ